MYQTFMANIETIKEIMYFAFFLSMLSFGYGFHKYVRARAIKAMKK